MGNESNAGNWRMIMKKIFILSLLITLLISNFSYSQLTLGKQWWDFVLYDRTIETTLSNVADADSSSVVWAKTANNWYNKIYSSTGALLYYFDTGGNLGLKTSGYLNFNTGTLGTSGYGFHDNAGTLQYKNSGGSWANIGTTLTQEQVEDYAGAMIANVTGTHTRIAITYQDATGDMDFVVSGGASEIQITFQAMSAKLPASNPAVIDGGENTFRLLFDADVDESVSWAGILDDDYGSGALYADVYFSMASATTDTVVWGIQVMAYTPGDAVDLNTDSYDTVNLDTVVVPGTAGYMKKTTITLSNDDSIAAGDLYRIKIYRDADSVSDAATNDAEIYYILIRE